MYFYWIPAKPWPIARRFSGPCVSVLRPALILVSFSTGFNPYKVDRGMFDFKIVQTFVGKNKQRIGAVSTYHLVYVFVYVLELNCPKVRVRAANVFAYCLAYLRFCTDFFFINPLHKNLCRKQ